MNQMVRPSNQQAGSLGLDLWSDKSHSEGGTATTCGGPSVSSSSVGSSSSVRTHTWVSKSLVLVTEPAHCFACEEARCRVGSSNASPRS